MIKHTHAHTHPLLVVGKRNKYFIPKAKIGYLLLQILNLIQNTIKNTSLTNRRHLQGEGVRVQASDWRIKKKKAKQQGPNPEINLH